MRTRRSGEAEISSMPPAGYLDIRSAHAYMRSASNASRGGRAIRDRSGPRELHTKSFDEHVRFRDPGPTGSTNY